MAAGRVTKLLMRLCVVMSCTAACAWVLSCFSNPQILWKHIEFGRGSIFFSAELAPGYIDFEVVYVREGYRDMLLTAREIPLAVWQQKDGYHIACIGQVIQHDLARRPSLSSDRGEVALMNVVDEGSYWSLLSGPDSLSRHWDGTGFYRCVNGEVLMVEIPLTLLFWTSVSPLIFSLWRRRRAHAKTRSCP